MRSPKALFTAPGVRPAGRLSTEVALGWRPSLADRTGIVGGGLSAQHFRMHDGTRAGWAQDSREPPSASCTQSPVPLRFTILGMKICRRIHRQRLTFDGSCRAKSAK